MSPLAKSVRYVVRWLDTYSDQMDKCDEGKVKMDWSRSVPFIIFHIALVGLFFVGFSWTALGVFLFLYFFRMFAITGFYHRYFSHRTFETSRPVQFLLAVAGNSAIQRGPLWWASHHRHHHKFSDMEEDNHSPTKHGFFWSHLGWIFSFSNIPTRLDSIKDFAAFPELKYLDRFDWFVPFLLGIGLYGLGSWLGYAYPELNTSGWQLFFWGFIFSTVLLFHGTFFINSLAHVWGSRRYETSDTSKNSFILALITLGEGWHNNHHYYPNATRQGFFWWEIDISFYLLKLMEAVGLIWNVRGVPKEKLHPKQT